MKYSAELLFGEVSSSSSLQLETPMVAVTIRITPIRFFTSGRGPSEPAGGCHWGLSRIFAEPLFCLNSFENGIDDGSECANSAVFPFFQWHLHPHALFEVFQIVI